MITSSLSQDWTVGRRPTKDSGTDTSRPPSEGSSWRIGTKIARSCFILETHVRTNFILVSKVSLYCSPDRQVYVILKTHLQRGLRRKSSSLCKHVSSMAVINYFLWFRSLVIQDVRLFSWYDYECGYHKKMILGHRFLTLLDKINHTNIIIIMIILSCWKIT